MSLPGWSFDRSWTLFLDRDGVINRRIRGGYVKNFNEFMFLDGVKEALATLSGIFGRIIVVSNQQGIGKGFMSRGDAEEIHRQMIAEITEAGGRIDRVYFSPHLEEAGHPDRKPGTGMALKAQQDFPEILFEKSLVAGDSPSDMEFGRRAGMVTVLLSDRSSAEDAGRLADFVFPDLITFAKALAGTNKPSF